MLDRTLLTLGAFRLDTVVLGPGESSVEVLEHRAIAVVLVSGRARCNGVDLTPWRSMTVRASCCLEAVGPCIVARVAVDGPDAVHLGERA
ncbi:hypothetical protein SAMN02745121_08764 [Nannocystis exedens]|uniref:AraC family transcriptional regulator n=1 Tax=Nannocystis exedens TaxID=54 RepID=A0A1I2IKZ4_9BACT|nr:hypothetical protein [Nannocystis exedens]PCC69307.1 hypothetical protein NAEX_02329 [Nannocystis exedens]SFF42288.1 hypothetical protein SAMN02745121_08764 [Nannocystis exedens]